MRAINIFRRSEDEHGVWLHLAQEIHRAFDVRAKAIFGVGGVLAQMRRDRKSTRLNSSHVAISYAVFCLKKKKEKKNRQRARSPVPHHRARRVPGRMRS